MSELSNVLSATVVLSLKEIPELGYFNWYSRSAYLSIPDKT